MARGQSPHRSSISTAPPAAPRPKSYGAVGDIWESLRDELRAIEDMGERSRRIWDLVDVRIKQMDWPQVCSVLADLEFEMHVREPNGVFLYEEPDTYAAHLDDDDEDDNPYYESGSVSTRSWSEFLDEMIDEGTPESLKGEESEAGGRSWESRCAALALLNPARITVAEAEWDYRYEHGSSYHKDETTLDAMLRTSVSLFLADKLRKRIENDPLVCDWEWSDLIALAEAHRARRSAEAA